MGLTSAQLKSAFFNVLYSDSAGTATRAALGADATSVIVREELNKAALPASPFVALQWGARASGGSRNRAVRTFYPVWFLYDQTIYRQSRLEPLVALIEAAYAEDSLTMCYTDFLPVRELLDEALNLSAKSMPFEIRTRG
jgi:hypothetical protein